MYLFEETIREAIEQGKIGTPVFLRWLVSDWEPGASEPLARMVYAAEGWLGSHCLRLAGAASASAWTLSGLCENGQSFLLSYAHCPSSMKRRSDLMLLGNRGALYYDDLPIDSPRLGESDSTRYQSLVGQIRDLQRSTRGVTMLQAGGENHE